MKYKITFLFFCFCFCNVKSQTIDSIQVAGLCKVWGLIKYYHPDVTKNKIDWDKVLVDNYPKFAQKKDFESFNKNIGQLIDGLNKKGYHLKVENSIFDAIVKDRIEKLENFNHLSDTAKFVNRISFSWINDSIFSKEIQYKLCEILLNYKPYKSQKLKGKVVVKHIENKFEELDSITEPYRILGLFRYWNTINYFFPYKYLSDNNWDSVLVNSINDMVTCDSYLAYTRQLLQLSSKINDSHGFSRYYNNKYYKSNIDTSKKEVVGYMPYNFRLINNYTIVSDTIDGAKALKIGDTILAVNNLNLEQYRNCYKEGKSNSTNQSEKYGWEVSVSNYQASNFNFQVLKETDTITVIENKIIDSKIKVESKYRKPPYYYSINDKAGYIELTQIKFSTLKKAFHDFKDKETIIFDMRGYPETIAWVALPYLLKKHPKKVATYYYPNKEYPGTFINNTKGESYRFWFVKPFILFKKQYKGKIIVLIDASAISQAETVCMMFKAYADIVTFIGTPTTGANGDISTIYEPGGIYFNFTSLDWHYPDGSQLQRIGIIPDIYVKETVEGIKLGKDEILERAIQFIDNSDN